MNCRRVLNVDNLVGSFSSSAAVRIFEDKRRASLVRADAAYDLTTMAVIIPLVRRLYDAHEVVMSASLTLEKLENVCFEKRTNLHERAAQRLSAPGGDLRQERVALQNALATLTRSHDTLYGPAVAEADRLCRTIMTAPLTGAAHQGLATPAAQARYMKCSSEACAGLFGMHNGVCLVCSTGHCQDCFERLGDMHACQPGARATARYVLANTKSCPRCHANIQRAAGCAQMMCTTCNCVFNWATGREEAGVVHNPHFFQLGAEARAAVAADRAARGLQAPSVNNVAPAVHCVEAEFDPMCVDFDDPRILEVLKKYLESIFPVRVRSGVQKPWVLFVHEYRHVLHTENITLREQEEKLRTSYGERAARPLRLARLLGAPLRELRRVGVQHPVTPLSKSHVVALHAPPLTDAKFAGQLMRIDTERSKHLERMEITRTFIETQKDLFRAALLVPPSERHGAVCRIFAFRLNKDRMIREVGMAKPPAAATGAEGTKKRKKGAGPAPKG
jgi:hypothetical protein